MAGVIRAAKVSKDVVFKVTLSTKDDREAKVRHTSVATQLNAHFEAVRAGPQELSHKRRLALAVQLYRLFVGTFDEDPGNPIMWANVHKWNTAATSDATAGNYYVAEENEHGRAGRSLWRFYRRIRSTASPIRAHLLVLSAP